MVLLSSCRIYKRILSSKLVSKNGQKSMTHIPYMTVFEAKINQNFIWAALNQEFIISNFVTESINLKFKYDIIY